LDEEITPNDFTLAKGHLNYVWEFILSHQGLVSESLLQSLVYPVPSVDLLGTVDHLTLAELNNAIEAFRRTSFSLLFLQGNIPVQSFSRIAAVLDEKNFGPYLDAIQTATRFTLKYSLVNPGISNPGEKCIRVKNLASNSLTTGVTNVYILGPFDTGDDGTNYFGAAMYFINCQAMLHLRTSLQLGYQVYARLHYDKNMRVPVMMFSIHVTATANKFTACELDQRIDEFLAQYGAYLSNMDDFLFNTMKTLTEAPASLTKEQTGAWFDSKFGLDFGLPMKATAIDKCVMRGIRKVSIQELSAGNAKADTKKCGCEKCSSIGTWSEGDSYKSKLTYAVGRGAMQDYFVKSTI